jgi:hypothetical protein
MNITNLKAIIKAYNIQSELFKNQLFRTTVIIKHRN